MMLELSRDRLRSLYNKARTRLVLKKKMIKGDRDFVDYSKITKLYTFASCKDCCSPDLFYGKIARIAKLYQSSIKGDDTSTVEWMCNYCGKPTMCSDSRLIDKLKRI